MFTKIRVLLHVASYIAQSPEKIVEAVDSFGSLVLCPPEGLYREIRGFTMSLEVVDLNKLIETISSIPFQSIADQITKDFDCPSVYVSCPKITPRGIFVTYSRSDVEKDMLFLKIVFEESAP